MLNHYFVLTKCTKFVSNTVKQDKKYCFLNEKQKIAFGSMFDEIDKDKNGYVTLEELKLRMIPSVSKSDIKHFLHVSIPKYSLVDI